MACMKADRVDFFIHTCLTAILGEKKVWRSSAIKVIQPPECPFMIPETHHTHDFNTTNDKILIMREILFVSFAAALKRKVFSMQVLQL